MTTRSSNKSKVNFGARISRISSKIARARHSVKHSARYSKPGYFWLLVLLFVLCFSKSNGHLTHRRPPINIQQARDILGSRYNFTCNPPYDVNKQRENVGRTEVTPNVSLTELKDDLHYIMKMAQVLKFHENLGNNSVHEILPDYPVPNITKIVTYQDAFNHANELMTYYMNGLEEMQLMMINHTMFGDRWANLTQIQMDLAAWIHGLHTRMMHQKMQINCDVIKKVLKLKKPAVSKTFQNLYMSSMMKKFIDVMGNVLEMFDNAIHHESNKRNHLNKEQQADKVLRNDNVKRGGNLLQALIKGHPRHNHRHRANKMW